MERERAAAVRDDLVAELVRTPGVLVRRREKELMNVPVGIIHDHELGLLRRFGMRERGQRHHRERKQNRADERNPGDEMFLHYRTSFQEKADG